MLGKRGRRPPMKRTTSLTEFTFDLTASTNNNYRTSQDQASRFAAATHPQNHPLNGVDQRYDHTNAVSSPPPSSRRLPQRRNSGDFVETAQFLRLCSLCNRRLVPGHDIYMYRGDNAFCSLECRQHQMAQDERKDKKYNSSNLASSKKLLEAPTAVPPVSAPASAGETVTAVV